MLTPPLVSVVVPAYNVGPYVRAAVDSALRQSFQDLEILVINDGSTDDTLERLSDLRDSRLRIVSRRHGGLSEARNTGVGLATGKYVAFLDGDDEWERDKLKYHIEVLDRCPEIDLTFCLSRVTDEGGADTGRISRRAAGDVSLRELLVENLVSNGSSAVVRREALRSAGGFDTSLRACEDHDMWIRIASLRQNNVWCVPLPLTRYRIRSGQMTKDLDLMKSQWERMMAKARSVAPVDVAATKAASRARFHRYLAYLAYEDRDFPRSLELLASALRQQALTVLRDRRTWILAGALLARRVLSDNAHRAVDQFARHLRARL
jgi:glycosyltransferase involved in cell wall biosynthesis